MSGVGLFINANYDSIYFNPAGAQNACPDKWRVPRIGEWDTLFNMNMVDMVNTIKSVIDNESELYNQYLEKIKKLKQDFFINPKYNVWERIKLLINE